MGAKNLYLKDENFELVKYALIHSRDEYETSMRSNLYSHWEKELLDGGNGNDYLKWAKEDFESVQRLTRLLNRMGMGLEVPHFPTCTLEAKEAVLGVNPQIQEG